MTEKVYCRLCRWKPKPPYAPTIFDFCDKPIQEAKYNKYNHKKISDAVYCKIKENEKGECPYFEYPPKRKWWKFSA